MSRLKATILCIDDHWNGLIGRKMLLENNGYKVLEATGGDEGLKLFLSHSTLQGLLDNEAKPFFSRWLDMWRNRNKGVE